MKRSQMVKLIAEALLEAYGGDQAEREEARESSKMRRLKMANLALVAAEDAGMLPPLVQTAWEAEDDGK
jgi:hypothetical protein